MQLASAGNRARRELTLVAVKALLGEECPSFELTMCKEYGTSCGLCPVSKSCRGCPLPCDDKEVTSSIKFAVGVDWDEAVCKELMEAQKSWVRTQAEATCSGRIDLGSWRSALCLFQS